MVKNTTVSLWLYAESPSMPCLYLREMIQPLPTLQNCSLNMLNATLAPHVALLLTETPELPLTSGEKYVKGRLLNDVFQWPITLKQMVKVKP